MNTPFVRWLLDLDAIPEGAEGLRFGWEHPLPAWLWALILLAAAAVAFASYWRLAGTPRVRAALAVARALLLLLLVALLCGPRVVLPQERVEPDWVLVLADRSESMSIADGDVVNGRRLTRDEELAAAVSRGAPLWSELAKSKRVVWLGFHAGAFDLATEDGVPVEFGEATGRRTRVGAALDQALQRAAARPISGVIVFSDGRTTDPPSRALLRKLQAEAAPVYTVPLGSTEALGDLAIRRVVAPDRAFVRDKVPVTIDLERFGGASGSISAVARLVDTRTGAELDRAEITPETTGEVTLAGRTEEPGEVAWRVVVESGAPDLVAENNERLVRIEFVERPLRVLLVEGYPRWEYHYLKNLLVREKSIESSIMLLSADRDFAQEGDVPITRLPRTAEEFGVYDLIVIGDVPSTFFTPEQLLLIRDAVAERGAGLLWMGGPRATPKSWSETVLADLLPMRPPLDLQAIGEPVNMVPTPQASRLGVLQIILGDQAGWPNELADPSYGWSQLQYAQRIEPSQLKPTSEALATTTEVMSGDALPLVVAMRYGAGQSIYVATDEIWRWRYGRGEDLPEQFWIQLVRMLGRQRLSIGDPAVLEVEPRRTVAGQPVRIVLRLLDEQLARPDRASVRVSIESTDGRRLAELDLQQADGAGGEYAAAWVPEPGAGVDELGEFVVRIDDPTVVDPEVSRLSATLAVERPDDERRQPETDHALLASLAAETGGAVLRPEELVSLKLPNREVRTENPITEPIWNTPLALALALLLLTTEWVGRKMIRLA